MIGDFGPDLLEPLSRKNKFINNLMQAPDGSITFPDSITLPSAVETDISSTRVRIGANEAEVDSAEFPFLDEPARIILDNLTEDYRNLLVDSEDDGSFEPCAPPQCKPVSFVGGTLVFDVNGFTTYSSEVNTDPTLMDVATAMPAEIKALLAEPGLSKSAKIKLKSARAKMIEAASHLKKDKVKNGLTEISKAVKDLDKAENEGAADLINRLAAVITRANATTLVANVISNVSTSGSIGGSRKAESAPYHSTDQVRLAQRLNRYLRGLLPQPIAARSSTSQIVARNVEIDETTRCDSGSFRIKGTLNHKGKGTLTIIFKNCRYDDETLNGKSKFRIVAFDLDDFFIKEAVISFSNLKMKTPTLSVSLGGSIKTKTNVGKDTERLTINMSVQDETTGKVTLAVNLVVVDVYNDIYSPSSYTETIDGRLYDSEHGFVDVMTLIPFDFSTIIQQFPDSGRLLLAGSLNSTILVTVISDTHIRLELDLDGDASFEIAAVVSWSELETEPDLADTDGDGMHDSWEQANGLDLLIAADADQDADSDGRTNLQEYLGGTNLNDANSFPQVADLSITKTDSADPVVVDTAFTYGLTVTNAGPDPASNIQVRDSLPTGVNFVGTSGIGWSCNNLSGTVICTRASLAIGVAPTITIMVTAPAATGSISNTASVSSITVDSIGSNNSATETTDMVLREADLSITKTDSVDPVATGTVFSYVLTVTNTGPIAATDVQVQDSLPAGVNFVSASGSGWGCNLASITVTCTRASLAIGVAPAITIMVTAPAATGSISNTASVSSITTDPNGSNNFGPEVTDAVPPILTFVGGVDGLGGARSVTVSPDGAHVYTAVFGDNAVAVYSRNVATGALGFVEKQKDGIAGVDGLNGAESVIVSPDGNHVYVAGHFDNAVAVFSRNATTGALTFVEVQKNGIGGVDGLGIAQSVAVSPDGGHVYVGATGIFFDSSVAVFSRNSSTGALSFVEVQTDYVGGVRVGWSPSVTVSPDGAHVYVAGTLDGALGDGAVSVFSRDPSTGALSFVEVQTDGVGGVAGIDVASSVTVSPDGVHVYVTGRTVIGGEGTVAVFNRDIASGALSFVEVQTDGIGGVDGLDFAKSVTVSPDGAHVYVAGNGDDAVVVFSRNAATGALTFVEVQKNGIGGVDGLDGLSLIVSPDGAHVYAAGQFDNAVAVFAADPLVPTVMRVNSVANTGDFQLTEDEQTVAAITQLLVSFGKPVQDPAGDTDPDDVTNPANYRVFTDGVDDNLESLACGAAQGDDGSMAINAVTYQAATRTATLSVNGGVALPSDAYRLFVCGPTIKDLDGNQLDGNVDGVGGDDFTRGFTVL